MNSRRNQKIMTVVGLILLLRKCFQLTNLIRSTSNKQKFLKNLPMMNVSQVIDYLKQNPTVKSFQCFVQGVIKSDKPLTSIYNKAQQLICDVVLGSYIHSNNNQQIVNSLDFKNKFIAVKPRLATGLKLYDMSDQTVFGNIKLAPDASITLAFSELNIQNINLQLGWLGKLWAMIAQIFKRCLFFVGRFFKGSEVQIVKQELGIKQKQFINVSAKCTMIKDTLNLYVTNMVKQSYMFHQKVGSILTGYKLSFLLFSALTVVYIIVLWKILKQTYNSIRQYLSKQFPQQLGHLQQQQFQGSDSQDGKFSCIICYTKIRSIIFKPCKHYSVCKLCYNSLATQNCPICKAEIEGIIEVKKRR